MKRLDTASLLKEIISSCNFPAGLEGAIITEHKEVNGWMLSVNWIPEIADKECLKRIALKHNLEITQVEGHVVFRSSPEK